MQLSLERHHDDSRVPDTRMTTRALHNEVYDMNTPLIPISLVLGGFMLLVALTAGSPSTEHERHESPAATPSIVQSDSRPSNADDDWGPSLTLTPSGNIGVEVVPGVTFDLTDW